LKTATCRGEKKTQESKTKRPQVLGGLFKKKTSSKCAMRLGEKKT